jgi:hypothetical protein
MAKLKTFEDTECEILDVLIKNEDSNRTYVGMVLRNDINEATFEATVMGDESARLEYVLNKHNYIGKLATVKFYERSGVKKVPYHGNVVSVREDADL